MRSLHADICRLAAFAFSTVKHTAREALASDYFLDALDDPDFAVHVRKRQPATLDAALAIALQMEAWKMSRRDRKRDKIEPSRYQRGSAMDLARK